MEKVKKIKYNATTSDQIFAISADPGSSSKESMPKLTIELELTEEKVQRIIEMFEEMDETLAEMRKISQELRDLSEMSFKELAKSVESE